MAFFFEREESDSEITIILKPHSLYAMLLLLATWLINDLVLHIAAVTQIIVPIFLVLMVVRFFSLVRVQKEILIAMKHGRVTTSGSKFSFANPFTYTLSK